MALISLSTCFYLNYKFIKSTYRTFVLFFILWLLMITFKQVDCAEKNYSNPTKWNQFISDLLTQHALMQRYYLSPDSTERNHEETSAELKSTALDPVSLNNLLNTATLSLTTIGLNKIKQADEKQMNPVLDSYYTLKYSQPHSNTKSIAQKMVGLDEKSKKFFENKTISIKRDKFLPTTSGQNFMHEKTDKTSSFMINKSDLVNNRLVSNSLKQYLIRKQLINRKSMQRRLSGPLNEGNAQELAEAINSIRNQQPQLLSKYPQLMTAGSSSSSLVASDLSVLPDTALNMLLQTGSADPSSLPSSVRRASWRRVAKTPSLLGSDVSGCIQKCVQQGILHPVQCHSLC